MKKSKILRIALLMIIVFAISACTGKKVIETGPVEIHYQVLFPENFNKDPLAKPYLDAVADFNQLNPNIKVIIDYVAPFTGTQLGTTIQQMVNLLESDKAPDVIPWFTNEIQVAGEKGLLRDLLPLQSKELDIPQQVLDFGTINGKLLVLPYGAHPSGIFYNKELFDEAEIPYPEGDWTWDQFRDISKKMKDHASLINYDFNSLDLLLASTGNGVLSYDGNTSIGYLDSPESVRMIQWLNALYRDNKNSPSPIGSSDVFGKFDGLQSGMIVGGFGDHFSNFEGENKKRLGIAPMPHVEGGQRVNPVMFTGYGISQKSKHPEAAWEFIQYLTVTNNKHSLKFAEDYIPTSKAMAEAVNVSLDPIRSIYNEEMKYAVLLSGEKNPFYFQAWNEDLKTQFQNLLTVKDEEIPYKLHELAQKLDQEMNRLKSESEAQAANATL
jgi:multiple sugar transport system substrate-binding protein